MVGTLFILTILSLSRKAEKLWSAIAMQRTGIYIHTPFSLYSFENIKSDITLENRVSPPQSTNIIEEY
jgi:hypothetical protein